MRHDRRRLRHWGVRQIGDFMTRKDGRIDEETGRRGDGGNFSPRLPVSPSPRLCISLSLCLSVFLALAAFAQSGRAVVSGRRVTVVSVFAKRVEDPNRPRSLLTGDALKKEEDEKIIPKQAIEFYDGGIKQQIQAFSPDPTPARIVVLMDNSLTLQTDTKQLTSV